MNDPIEDLYFDISSCLLALVNALEANNAVSRAQIAEAAQERLLVLSERFPPERTRALVQLRALANLIQRTPSDL